MKRALGWSRSTVEIKVCVSSEFFYQRAAEENLIALESYTRRENLRFVNIAEEPGEDCTEVVLDIIQNELKINTDGLRFHAVHRVGKRRIHIAALRHYDRVPLLHGLW